MCKKLLVATFYMWCPLGFLPCLLAIASLKPWRPWIIHPLVIGGVHRECGSMIAAQAGERMQIQWQLPYNDDSELADDHQGFYIQVRQFPVTLDWNYTVLQQAHSPSMDDRDDILLFCTELSIIAMYDRGWSCEAYFLALFVNCAMSVMWFSPSCGDSGHLVDGIDGIVSAIEHSTFGIWNWVSHFWVWMCWERRRLSF